MAGIVHATLHVLGRERRVIAFFGFVLLLLAPYLTAPPFIDELDNLLGARSVGAGGVVYRDFYSQHTPLMYYIMGAFARIGISSVAGLRICFYVLITGLFAFVYYRYRGVVGARTLLMLPVFFVLDMARNAPMSTVLSDTVQAMALLILFLEFFDYSVRKPTRLTRASSVVIALAIFVAVGVAFMSVYAIAVIFLGVVLVELERRGATRSDARVGPVRTGIELARRYGLVAASLAVLGILYAGYFAANHALRAMIYQSFTFNNQVYSKYTGMSGALGAAFDCFGSFANHISGTLSQLSTFASFTAALLIVANVVACCLFFEKSKALGIASALFTVYAGIRGFTGFHSTPYALFSWFCVAYIIERIAFNPRRNRALVASVVILVFSFMPSWGPAVAGVHGPTGLKHVFDAHPDYYVQKYVPKGGYVYDASLDASLFFNNDVKPPSRLAGALVPWFADAFMPDLMADLEKNKPNVVIYSPDDVVWGHKFSEFSQPLEALLARDYVYYPFSDAAATHRDAESSRVWIRKGLGVNALFTGVVYDQVTGATSLEPAGEITDQRDVVQTFELGASDVSGVAVNFATYARTNTSHLSLELGRFDRSNNAEQPLITRSVDASKLSDNALGFVSFGQSLSLPPGEYYVRLSSDDGAPGNAVTAWIAKDGGATPGKELLVGGVAVQAQLDFELLK